MHGQTESFPGMVMHELSEPVVHRKDQFARSLEITGLAALSALQQSLSIWSAG
jgi:hypothetical protein